MVSVLQKSSRSSLMLSEAKKRFLQRVLSQKHDIIHSSQLFDATVNSSLTPAFEIMIPANIRSIKRSNNNDLSDVIAKLLPPFKMLRSYMISQYDQATGSKPSLRPSTNEQHHQNPVMEILDEAFQIYSKLEDAVISV